MTRRQARKAGRDFYVRQLKDWNFFRPDRGDDPLRHGRVRPAVRLGLGPAHAASGDRIALAAYLGGSAKFDQAIAGFAETYADQNERDYAALQAAVNGKPRPPPRSEPDPVLPSIRNGKTWKARAMADVTTDMDAEHAASLQRRDPHPIRGRHPAAAAAVDPADHRVLGDVRAGDGGGWSG